MASVQGTKRHRFSQKTSVFCVYNPLRTQNLQKASHQKSELTSLCDKIALFGQLNQELVKNCIMGYNRDCICEKTVVCGVARGRATMICRSIRCSSLLIPPPCSRPLPPSRHHVLFCLKAFFSAALHLAKLLLRSKFCVFVYGMR